MKRCKALQLWKALNVGALPSRDERLARFRCVVVNFPTDKADVDVSEAVAIQRKRQYLG